MQLIKSNETFLWPGGRLDGSNDTVFVKIGAASEAVSESEYLRHTQTDGHTDAQTFVQFFILSRYVYVKVGLEAFVKKFIFRAIL